MTSTNNSSNPNEGEAKCTRFFKLADKYAIDASAIFLSFPESSLTT